MSWTSSQLRCFTGAFCLLLAADQLASAQDIKKARLRLDFSAVGYLVSRRDTIAKRASI